MSSPAENAGGLIPSTVVGGTTGWTLKVGKLPADPDLVVVMYDTGGLNPNPRWAVDFSLVQATVRAGPNAYGVGWDKIRQVRDALLGLSSLDVNGDRWVSVTCMGDAGFMAYDDKQRPMFTCNFKIIIEPANTGNREAL